MYVHSQLHARMVSMQLVMYRFVKTTVMQSRSSLERVPQFFEQAAVSKYAGYRGEGEEREPVQNVWGFMKE